MLRSMLELKLIYSVCDGFQFHSCWQTHAHLVAIACLSIAGGWLLIVTTYLSDNQQ